MDTNHDRGFTLVELLVVMVILCILATVTIFTVRGLTGQRPQSACETGTVVMVTVVADGTPADQCVGR
jgi:prepilin-type N-terminal cleavage/methylation domain-containing protein